MNEPHKFYMIRLTFFFRWYSYIFYILTLTILKILIIIILLIIVLIIKESNEFKFFNNDYKKIRRIIL